MEVSGALTKVLPQQCGRNTPGLLYIDKNGRKMKILQAAGENSSGFTNESSLQGEAFRRDMLDQKSPPFPGAGVALPVKSAIHMRM